MIECWRGQHSKDSVICPVCKTTGWKIAEHIALGGAWWNREDLPEQRIVDVGTGQADIPAEGPGEVHSIGTALSGIFRSDTSP